MDTLDSDNPLLNDYKLQYVLKLLLQTFLGGAQLKFSFLVPVSVYLVQLLLWACPLVLAVLFTLIVHMKELDMDMAMIIFGVCLFIFNICIHITAYVLRKRLGSVRDHDSSSFYSDENEVEFVTFPETLEFLIPKKRRLWSYLFHPIMYAMSCAFTLPFLFPYRTQLLFNSTVASWIIFVLGWLAACCACYPLIGQNPKEPACFRIADNLELLPLSRTFYVAGVSIFTYVANKFCSGMSCGALTTTDYVLHIVFIFFPFLWLFGVLPPLDALLSWSTEQFLVHVLGGTHMASDLRLFISVVLAMVSVLVVHFIPVRVAAVIVLTTTSLVLALDVCSLLLKVIGKIPKIVKQVQTGNKTGELRQRAETSWNWKSVCCISLALILSNTTTVVIELFYHKDSHSANRFNSIGAVLIAVSFLHRILSCFQHIFVLCNLITNPLYSRFSKRREWRWIIGLFSQIVLPLWLVVNISVILKENNPKRTTNFFDSLMKFRAYRMIWSNAPKCALDVVVYIILVWCNFDIHTNVWWSTLPPCTKLFVISILLYLLIELFKKLSFVLILLAKSHTDKAKHRSKVNTAISTAVVLLPLTILIFIVTMVTGSPLLPLFTLPLFVVGFPRPLRMWPDAHVSSRSSSKDWIYYQQLMPSLIKEIRSKFLLLGNNTFRPGKYFLGRFQDRLIWLSILESGFTHCSFVVKGLELQETSCHTTEAQMIDQLFQDALQDSPMKFNTYPTSVLTPTFSLNLEAYSDARYVLAGIIDKPSTLKSITTFFPKVLLMFLLRHAFDRNSKCTGDEVEGEDGCFTARTAHTETTILSPCLRDSLNVAAVVEDGSDGAINTIKESMVNEDKCIFPLTPVEVTDSIPGKDTNVPNDVNKNSKEPAIMNLAVASLSDDEFGKDINAPSDVNKSSHEPVITSLAVASLSDDDEFGEFGFSDGESDREPSSDSDDDIEAFGSHLPGIANTPAPIYNMAESSKVLAPPSRWTIDTPFTEKELSSYFHLLPISWFKRVINSLPVEQCELIELDSGLFNMYRRLVLTSHLLVNVVGVCDEDAVKAGPAHVLRMFKGTLPWSQHSKWIEGDPELKEIIARAYRYAFKAALDNEVMGDAETDDELFDMLVDYQNNWFIGDQTSEQWTQSVIEETPNLLTMYQENDEMVYASRTLSKQLMEVPLGELNEECVRGFWSALCLELFYMTNDDDERYSIQALPPLLRNIITQAADPPLGYPVYSSGLVTVYI